MPDTLSLSAGVSLGLLAGIVSGVCYLVANGVTWTKDEGANRRRCLKASRAFEDGVCATCGGDRDGGYVPCICQDYRPVKFEQGAWFLRQVQRAASLMPWSTSTDKLEQIDEEYDGRDSPGPSSREEQHHATVREFLETLAGTLAGGTLEGTRVSPLYHHPAYLPPLRNGSQSSASSRPSSGASSAHVHLKRLVARVVEEAATLPALAQYAAEPHTPTIENSTYEDLLASAILNKVIERFQNENGSGGRSSGIHSASASPTPSETSSPRSLNRTTRDITPPLQDDVSDWEEGEATDEAVEVPRRVPFPEFGGDIVHHNDENEEREFDEVSSSDLQGVDGTWEENWLFQKKKIKTIQSVPVPMLVPNSNTDYRALIGDRDADDTTDLSDNASDNEEQGEYKSDIKKVLDSKHVIGGKMKIDDESDYEPDSLTMDEDFENFDQLAEHGYKNDVAVDAIITEMNKNVSVASTTATNEVDVVDGIGNGKDSVLIVGIDDGPLPKAEFNLKEEIHRTLMNGTATHYMNEQHEEFYDDSIESMANNKESNNNTLNHHEREGEYEETVTIPVQRYADSLRRKHFEDTNLELHAEGGNNTEDDLLPGSVAYRERKKWLNCVEMPNNPYSPEAIQKRLLAKSTSSLFDMITSSKTEDFEENESSEVVFVNSNTNAQNDEFDSEETKPSKLSASVSTENIVTENRSKSPSPRILKEVLAEEVPQYKRYGRDYYIREAKASAGGRKKISVSDTSSISSMNKSTSLDNFDTEFASPVSASSSLSDLEACALHQNIVRAVLSPRNASPNFAINPIFEQPDRQIDNSEYPKERYVDRKPTVREPSRNVCNGGDGYVENEDIVRLKIPNKPEITEDLFESYTNVRRNNTLRSEDLYVRAKRRPGLNFTFGGSLSTFTTVILQDVVGLLIKQFNVIATNQHYTRLNGKDQIASITTTPNNKTEIFIEYEDHDPNLYSARPVIVDDDTDDKFEEILQSAYKSELALNDTEQDNIEEPIKSPISVANSYISSSSLEDSIKIYNVQTGEVIKCRPEDNISARYETTADNSENIDIKDKNIPGDILDGVTQNGDVEDDAVIIEESIDDNLEISELEDIVPHLPKVKELAKKFVSMDNLNEPLKVAQPYSKRRRSKENVLNDVNGDRQPNKQMYMHSLTARSISKEFREELKLSMATPLKVPGGSKETPNGEEVTKESSRPGSPVPEPGTIKTKLAFFESLKTKFSSK